MELVAKRKRNRYSGSLCTFSLEFEFEERVEKWLGNARSEMLLPITKVAPVTTSTGEDIDPNPDCLREDSAIITEKKSLSLRF